MNTEKDESFEIHDFEAMYNAIIGKPNIGDIYTTIGVYANGDMKVNGVPGKDLEDHIKYNLEKRPGRAFFVNGYCINRGYLRRDEAKKYQRIFLDDLASDNSKYKQTKDTAPYV